MYYIDTLHYINNCIPNQTTHIYFMQQNRAYWLLSSIQRFIFLLLLLFLYFDCLKYLLCGHFALSILLLCYVFTYVMFHVSLYIFFVRLFISDTDNIKYSRVGLKIGAYIFVFVFHWEQKKCARVYFVFDILLFFEFLLLLGFYYYEFQCFGMWTLARFFLLSF